MLDCADVYPKKLGQVVVRGTEKTVVSCSSRKAIVVPTLDVEAERFRRQRFSGFSGKSGT
jgi:hypothetical protein